MSSGIRSKPLYKMAQLIAASVTFQAVVGAADAAAALLSVYVYEGIDKDDTHPRPRAIIGFGPDWNARKIGTGARFYGGTIEICFEFNQADGTADNPGNLLAFADTVGAIINECEALAGVGDAGDGETYLNVVEFTAQGRPDFSSEKAENGQSYLIDNYLARWEG